MQQASLTRRFAGISAAAALCISSSAGAAAPRTAGQPASISPLVALSALASDASAAALCGASAAMAASAAATAQAAQPGCVLPVVDAPVAPVVTEALPPPPVAPPPVPAAGGGFGVSPLLLGLAGIAAAVLAFVLLRDKDDNDSPE